MKIIVLIFISATTLFANYQNFDFKYQTSDLKKYKLFKDISERLEINPQQETQLYLKYGNDEDFKKGLYNLTIKTVEQKVGNKSYDMPDYHSALKNFEKSSKSDNILASYAGFIVLEKYFLMKGNSYGKKFLRGITAGMHKGGYILGSYWHGKSHLKEWSKSPDYDKAIGIFKKVKNDLEKKGKDKSSYQDGLILDQVQRDLAIASAMKKVIKSKESGNYLRVKRRVYDFGGKDDKKD